MSLTLTVIDTINADAVENGDYVETDGIVGHVIKADDQGDVIVLTLRTDSDGEVDEYPLFASDVVNLLALR